MPTAVCPRLIILVVLQAQYELHQTLLPPKRKDNERKAVCSVLQQTNK